MDYKEITQYDSGKLAAFLENSEARINEIKAIYENREKALAEIEEALKAATDNGFTSIEEDYKEAVTDITNEAGEYLSRSESFEKKYDKNLLVNEISEKQTKERKTLKAYLAEIGQNIKETYDKIMESARDFKENAKEFIDEEGGLKAILLNEFKDLVKDAQDSVATHMIGYYNLREKKAHAYSNLHNAFHNKKIAKKERNHIIGNKIRNALKLQTKEVKQCSNEFSLSDKIAQIYQKDEIVAKERKEKWIEKSERIRESIHNEHNEMRTRMEHDGRLQRTEFSKFLDDSYKIDVITEKVQERAEKIRETVEDMSR